ncbi:hypothetical protein B0H16DRAFT_1757012 [Mycena metata]|uniref:DUF6589 domain-containing protein n=1 Tax=Mycena metata TaxID=1033252 RepID=A0AAD7NUR7_9AGAR|nr:hypothetical protein B0H16DRAFT_1757012 [Mycena metata]
MDNNTPAPPSTRHWKPTPAPLPVPMLESILARGTSSSTSTVPHTSVSSTQERLRGRKHTHFQKIDTVLKTWGFKSVGEFLATLFHPRIRGKDKRTRAHRQAVAIFLQGRTAVAMADIIPLIYNHHKSRPRKRETEQRAAAFSPHKPLEDIRPAATCLSAWATRLVGDAAHSRIGKMSRKSRDNVRGRRHLRASSNGRTEGTRVVEWEDVEFTMEDLAQQYQSEDELIWYLTECFAASRKNGKVIVKKIRPHPVIQVGAISAFITARNQYASGDIGLPIGIWLFACQAHVDIKHILCRFGYSVSDSTARRTIRSMTLRSLRDLREKVCAATAREEVEYGKVSDNCQRYTLVCEHGIGRENELKVGTACTAFRLDDCAPGAFRADDHIRRVVAQERQRMTTEDVYKDINWVHIDGVAELHFVRVLANFCPHLNHLLPAISTLFRTKFAKHRLTPCKKELQALGPNSERELENKGYYDGFMDFDKQMGVEPDKSDNLLSLNCGDGAAHAMLMRLKKLMATTKNIYQSLRNAISNPEVFHTRATKLNYFGPAASSDPSSLSRASNAANMKRPTDLKKCDFYPTSRSMTLIWEAQVLDCWRLILGCENDLISHFDQLAENDASPTLEDLLKHGSVLRARYASQPAYKRSLDKEEHDKASSEVKVPDGSPWTSPCAPDTCINEDAETPDAADPPLEATPGKKKSADSPQTHIESSEFDGDRVLSNSILFLMECGWWAELNYAIPEGNIGRVLEVFKILIFEFGGTANQNYMGMVYSITTSSIWMVALEISWSVNMTQEWFNRWLEEMAGKRGGEFDESYYREIIAPNVWHFLQMRENMESSFALKRRGKSHTSPHLGWIMSCDWYEREEFEVMAREEFEVMADEFCGPETMLEESEDEEPESEDPGSESEGGEGDSDAESVSERE